jgi:hypothetical protein
MMDRLRLRVLICFRFFHFLAFSFVIFAFMCVVKRVPIYAVWGGEVSHGIIVTVCSIYIACSVTRDCHLLSRAYLSE